MVIKKDIMPRGVSIQDVRKTKIGIYEVVNACISVVTMVYNIFTDGEVAYKHYSKKDWTWFGLTLAFIIVPSILMQIFSWLLYRLKTSQTPSVLSMVLHVLQLGVFERHLRAVYYGMKSRRQVDSSDKFDVKHYLENARDTAFIRLIESSMESGPQLLLQLYILSTYGRPITFAEDGTVIRSSIFSCYSLAQSLVAYSKRLRSAEADPVSHEHKSHTICGAFFQLLYRVCIVSCRVVALVLFATEFKLWVLLVIGVHVVAMVIGLFVVKTTFFSNEARFKNQFEIFFRFLLSFIYVFCFLTPIDGRTRIVATCYYIFMLIENSILFSLWITSYSGHSELLIYGGTGFIWGGFVFGVFLIAIYYRYFHPRNDVTEECESNLRNHVKQIFFCCCTHESVVSETTALNL